MSTTAVKPMAEEIKALVVDDEPTVRMALQMALEDAGWRVACAESAEDALQNHQIGTYDVVLSDKNLPGMSGVELIRKARQGNPHQCLVMITGYASVESAVETMHLGIDGYIEKPFDDIFSVVRKVKALHRRCDRRRKEGEGEARLVDGPRPAPGTQKVRVILTVPSLPDRSWLSQHIRRDGIEIIEAASAAIALHSLNASPADLLIADATVTNPSIYDLIEQAKETRPNLAVVVLTDKPALNDMIRYIDLRVKSILERPLSDEKFARKVGLVLDILLSNQKQQAAQQK